MAKNIFFQEKYCYIYFFVTFVMKKRTDTLWQLCHGDLMYLLREINYLIKI